MKLVRVVAAIAVLVVVVTVVHTQTRSRARTRAPQPKRSAAVANIAVIDTTAFTDQKTGINRMMSAMQQLNAKYELHPSCRRRSGETVMPLHARTSG